MRLRLGITERTSKDLPEMPVNYVGSRIQAQAHRAMKPIDFSAESCIGGV